MGNLWIARDKDGSLLVYREKPIRDIRFRIFNLGEDVDYDDAYLELIKIPPSMYPEVTWENSPKELVVKED